MEPNWWDYPLHADSKCFACDRAFVDGERVYVADTRDDQIVQVGSTCLKKIKKSGDEGWQPPKGGPRLYMPEDERITVETYHLHRTQP